MISISTCAFLQLIGAAYSREQIWINNISNFTRISSFGVDPNFVGYQYSIGLLIAITILFGLLESGKFIWIISFLSGLVNLLALLQTGSRGAIISLVFSIFTLPMVKKPLKIKIRILFYIIVFIGVLYTIIQNNIGLYMRFIQTFIYFDTANRIEIYSAAIKTLISRPVIGYGPYYNLFILPKYYYIGPILDTHNIFLWVLTSSGIIGFVPFALIILISGINAYKSRIGKDNIVPFSLFCLLFMFSQTVTNINNKLFWIILAYAASSNFFLRLSNKNINKEIVSAMRPEILETKSPVNY
jgi:O-antigen ligase